MAREKRTKTQVDNYSEVEDGRAESRGSSGRQEVRRSHPRGVRDSRPVSGVRRDSTACTRCWPTAYLAKGNKTAAMAQLANTPKSEDETPEILKKLATLAGRSRPETCSRGHTGAHQLRVSAGYGLAQASRVAVPGTGQERPKRSASFRRWWQGSRWTRRGRITGWRAPMSPRTVPMTPATRW